MSDIFEASFNLIDGFIFMDFLLRYNGLKWKNNKIFIGLSVVMAVIIYIVNMFTSMTAAEMIIYAISMFILSKFADQRIDLKSIVFSILWILLIIAVVNSVIAILFSYIFNVNVESLLIPGNPLRIMCSLLMKLFMIILSNFFIKLNNGRGMLNVAESIILLLVHIISLIIMEITFKYEMLSFNEEMLIIILGILFINIAIYIIYSIINKVNSDNLNYQIELQSIKYEDDSIRRLKETEENIRTIKHEIKGKMHEIIDILENEDSCKAKQDILNYVNEIDNVYSYVNSNNKILNYILNYNISIAKSRGIDVETVIAPKIECKLSPADLSGLFNNMLTNAIEALDGQEKPYLYIEVSRYADYQKFVVINSLDKPVLNENPELKTTKKDRENHGYGLNQIYRIAEKGKGYVDIKETEKYFIVSAFILI